MLEKSSDLSNKMIFILFVVTLLVSAIGSFLVLKSVNEISGQDDEGPVAGSASGSVSLTIDRPPISNGGVQLEVLSDKDLN